jgi:hypothetical protein
VASPIERRGAFEGGALAPERIGEPVLADRVGRAEWEYHPVGPTRGDQSEHPALPVRRHDGLGDDPVVAAPGFAVDRVQEHVRERHAHHAPAPEDRDALNQESDCERSSTTNNPSSMLRPSSGVSSVSKVSYRPSYLPQHDQLSSPVGVVASRDHRKRRATGRSYERGKRHGITVSAAFRSEGGK